MNRSIITPALLIFGLSASLHAAPCATGALSTYLAPGYGCTVGDFTFDSFAAVISAGALNGTASPDSADDITVTPYNVVDGVGFSFSGNFLSTAGFLGASSVTFTVGFTGYAPEDASFTSVDLSLSSAGVSGLGAITGTEALCLGGSFTSPLTVGLCSGLAVNTGLLAQITNANLGANITTNFDDVKVLGVIKQVTLTSPALNSTASLTAVNNIYGIEINEPAPKATPEPATWGISAACLIIAAIARRRRMV